MEHCLVLSSALVEAPGIDVKLWLRRISINKLSAPELRDRLADALGKPRRPYLKERGRRFRITTFEFDPSTTTRRDQKAMATALRRALTLLAKAK
jgi:hypothetical protein